MEMSDQLKRLLPGIKQMFEQAGAQVDVQDTGPKIRIVLTQDGYSETQEFDYPSTNAELSGVLIGWRATFGQAVKALPAQQGGPA